MTTTIETDTTVAADPYSRPNAQFTEDGVLEVRASAMGDCRRALWYAATGHPVTNPTAESALTVMEAGTALEPVVLRAMERAGWEIHPADRDNPQRVSVPISPTMRVSGHPDATGIMPIFGGEAVIEVKTRNPDAFKRWQVLGAERSHPNAVAQAAVYTLGTFGEMRDAVIACMDTGSRSWDYEVIPGERLEKALAGCQRAAWETGRPPRPYRARPRRPARTRLHRGVVAVPRLPVPGDLPAGGRCRRTAQRKINRKPRRR